MDTAKNQGFTIVELMIATLVFSVILLMTLGGFIQIGRTFYKGMTISRTENTIRTIADNISSDIRVSPVAAATTTRISSTGISTGISYFCIGQHIYFFKAGTIFDRDFANSVNRPDINSSYGLKRADTGPTGCDPNAPLTNLQELLGEKMRVSKLYIQCSNEESNRLCELSIHIAYGDNDLLYSPGDLPPTDKPYQAPDALCKGATAGTQFCATADINTSIIRGGNS